MRIEMPRTTVPELPDVVVYLDAIERDIVGKEIRRIDVRGLAVLKSYDPPISEAHGKTVTGTRRLGKRLVFELEDDLFFEGDPTARAPQRNIGKEIRQYFATGGDSGAETETLSETAPSARLAR